MFQIKKLYYIGAGGFAGATIRYLFRNIDILPVSNTFITNILIVNAAGCLMLSFAMAFFLNLRKVDENIYSGITTGLFGALTTFSAMCRETVNFFEKESYGGAAVYILLSVASGILFSLLGMYLGSKVVKITAGTKRPLH